MKRMQLNLALPQLQVNLELPERGICAIMGPSGAGKTTLLRAVAGLEPQVLGRIEVNGTTWLDSERHVCLPTYQRPIGFVFQEASLFAHLTVQKNIEFGYRRVPAAVRKIPLQQVIALLDIETLLPRSVAHLSGGEQQRINIARALATSPELLLMDEPLAALDEQRKAEIVPYLERLNEELTIPILYVSHAPSEVARLANYVVMLDDGRVRAQGAVVDVLSRADLPFAHGDAAFSLLSARVLNYDSQYQLLQMEFDGGVFWLPQAVDSRPATGAHVRLRIQARDVSISLQEQKNSSILNCVKAELVDLRPDGPGLVMVELQAQAARLLARITCKSADALQLRPGMTVYAQIKGVALTKSSLVG